MTLCTAAKPKNCNAQSPLPLWGRVRVGGMSAANALDFELKRLERMVF